MQATVGNDYTSKLQKMMSDVTLADDLNENFRKFISASGTKLGFFTHLMFRFYNSLFCLLYGISLLVGLGVKQFDVLILTTGSWPFRASEEPPTLPLELNQSIEKFEMYYQVRRRQWQLFSKGVSKITLSLFFRNNIMVAN